VRSRCGAHPPLREPGRSRDTFATTPTGRPVLGAPRIHGSSAQTYLRHFSRFGHGPSFGPPIAISSFDFSMVGFSSLRSLTMFEALEVVERCGKLLALGRREGDGEWLMDARHIAHDVGIRRLE
jgi:hypothetical protein